MGQPKFTTVKDLKDYLDLLPKEMDDYRVGQYPYRPQYSLGVFGKGVR